MWFIMNHRSKSRFKLIQNDSMWFNTKSRLAWIISHVVNHFWFTKNHTWFAFYIAAMLYLVNTRLPSSSYIVAASKSMQPSFMPDSIIKRSRSSRLSNTPHSSTRVLPSKCRIWTQLVMLYTLYRWTEWNCKSLSNCSALGHLNAAAPCAS